jgi:hypothetical protein
MTEIKQCGAHRGDPQTWCPSCRKHEAERLNAAAAAESARRIRERLEDAESDRLLAKMTDWDEESDGWSNREGQPEFNGSFR